METMDTILDNQFFNKAIFVLIGVTIIMVLIHLLKRSLSKYIKDQDHSYRTRKAATIFGYLLSILLMSIIFSEQLGGITVFLGFASAGIAFALQEVIVSFAGWVSIMAGGIFKAGDRVKLGGIKGDVIDLGVLRTTIMEVNEWVNGDLYNGRIVRVANSFVFKEPVFNYSSDFPFLWDEITVPIKYGSDYNAAKQIITQVSNETVGDYSAEAKEHWDGMVRKFLIENARTEPIVTLKANDNWVEFTLRYVVDYRKRRTTQDNLFTRILEEIDKTESNVQFASATFDLVNVPSLDIRVKDQQ